MIGLLVPRARIHHPHMEGAAIYTPLRPVGATTPPGAIFYRQAQPPYIGGSGLDHARTAVLDTGPRRLQEDDPAQNISSQPATEIERRRTDRRRRIARGRAGTIRGVSMPYPGHTSTSTVPIRG